LTLAAQKPDTEGVPNRRELALRTDGRKDCLVNIRNYESAYETEWLRCRVLAFLDTAYFDDVCPTKPTYENPSVELVALHDNQVVGLLDVEYETTPGSVCAEGEGLGGMIWELAVHPDWRRRGIARTLLAEAVLRLQEQGVVRLEAWTRDDEGTRAWYVSQGFVKMATYLHVFLQGTEGTLTSTVPGLKPVWSFAHYIGDNPDAIKRRFRRVHECCLYKLDFRQENSFPKTRRESNLVQRCARENTRLEPPARFARGGSVAGALGRPIMEPKEYRSLHAEWYELASAKLDHSKEIELLARRIQEAGQPVLELGSGTGRILIPLLESGFDICGIDTSPHMLDRCRAALHAKGLKAELHQQSMLDFALPQKYRVILLASGSLGLFISDDDIHRMFERVVAHLEPGGLFIYEFEQVTPTRDNSNGSGWTGDWMNGPDDVVIAWRNRNKYDVATHVWERLFVLEKYVSGRLVETEANERTGRFFTVEEAVRFAKSAGFVGIKATNWLTEEPPSDDSAVITVQCRKAGQPAN
jgi:ribosomal protein S18 acetylase RimI-like enzyme/SAM-dependent methyltransferase